MINNHLLWNKLTEKERKELTKLLLNRKRTKAIRYVLRVSGLNVGDARNFIDNTWLHLKATDCDPTRMSAKEEFKAGVLRIVVDMLATINNPETLTATKYDLLKNDTTKLFELCMED